MAVRGGHKKPTAGTVAKHGKIQFYSSYLWLWRFSNSTAPQEGALNGAAGENERFRKKAA
jgi:hypothetical protein